MDEWLRSGLADADPGRDGVGNDASGLVREMTHRAEAHAAEGPNSRGRWWKRRRFAVPLGVAGVAVLTGGAVLLPLTLTVDGDEVDPDLRLSVDYTTSSGVAVGCEYWIYFGSPAERDEANERLVSFLQDHDWDDLGQRAYAEAISDPFTLGNNGWLQSDSQEARDKISLERGILFRRRFGKRVCGYRKAWARRSESAPRPAVGYPACTSSSVMAAVWRRMLGPASCTISALEMIRFRIDSAITASWRDLYQSSGSN